MDARRGEPYRGRRPAVRRLRTSAQRTVSRQRLPARLPGLPRGGDERQRPVRDRLDELRAGRSDRRHLRTSVQRARRRGDRRAAGQHQRRRQRHPGHRHRRQGRLRRRLVQRGGDLPAPLQRGGRGAGAGGTHHVGLEPDAGDGAGWLVPPRLARLGRAHRDRPHSRSTLRPRRRAELRRARDQQPSDHQLGHAQPRRDAGRRLPRRLGPLRLRQLRRRLRGAHASLRCAGRAHDRRRRHHQPGRPSRPRVADRRRRTGRVHGGRLAGLRPRRPAVR